MCLPALAIPVLVALMAPPVKVRLKQWRICNDENVLSLMLILEEKGVRYIQVVAGLNLSHESELSRGSKLSRSVKGLFLLNLLPFPWSISIFHPGAFHCNRHLKERLHLSAGCRRNFEIHQERWHLWPGWNPLLKPSEKIFSLLDWRNLVPVGHMWRLFPLLTWHCGKINL